MNFTDWTAKAVEDRILEMADTLRMSPSVKGPQAFGSSMPEAVQRHSEAYGLSAPDIAKPRRRAPWGEWSRYGDGSTPCR